MKTEEAIHRLAMIKDDLKAIREFIDENELHNQFSSSSKYCDKAMTHLNNIEIACDINSQECLSWKQFTNN